jgi:hypothetical protein
LLWQRWRDGLSRESDLYNADRTKACLEEAGYVVSIDRGNQVEGAGPSRPTVVGFLPGHRVVAFFSRDEEVAQRFYDSLTSQDPVEVIVRRRNVVYWIGGDQDDSSAQEARDELERCLRS